MAGMQERQPILRPEEIVIDEELRDLIPPLTGEEFLGLEKDIISNGCKIPLIVWYRAEDKKYVLLDGHNRYRICMANKIPFKAGVDRDCLTKEDAALRIISLQLNRRNITSYTRVELAMKRAEYLNLKEKAKANQYSGEKINEAQEDHHKNSTDEKIGALAQISRETVRKVKKIQENAPEEVISHLRTGEISIDQGFKFAQMPEQLRKKVSRQIGRGADAKDAIAAGTKKYAAEQKREKENAEKESLDLPLKDVPKENEHGRFFSSAVSVMGENIFDITEKDIETAGLEAELRANSHYIATRTWPEDMSVWADLTRDMQNLQLFVTSVTENMESGEAGNEIMIVVPAKTEKGWFHQLFRCFDAVCFAMKEPEAVFYRGCNLEKFEDEFGQFGTLLHTPEI